MNRYIAALMVVSLLSHPLALVSCANAPAPMAEVETDRPIDTMTPERRADEHERQRDDEHDHAYVVVENAEIDASDIDLLTHGAVGDSTFNIVMGVTFFVVIIAVVIAYQAGKDSD